MRSRWLCLLPCAACLPPRIHTTRDEVPIVARVHFQGNGGSLSSTGDYLLRGAMVQQASPAFWRLAPRKRALRLDGAELYRDAYRIETWYAHHGFFDARFLGWELVQQHPTRGHRTPVVTLIGHVEEGAETTISSVTWEMVDEKGAPTGQSFESAVGRPLANLLRRSAPAQKGDRFGLDAYNETRDATVARLQDTSFAYATVSGEVKVDADQHAAELRFLCHPGPPCTVGAVHIKGRSKVPEALIRDQVHIEQGDAFSASDLAKTQRDLFALGTFSMVNVVPELDLQRPLPEDPGYADYKGPSSVVPVDIEIRDSRWRQLKLGGGVAVEDGKEELHASTSFQHANLLNRLLHLSADLTGGYTWLASWGDVLGTDSATSESDATLSGGPSLTLDLGLDLPRFLRPTLRLENDLTFALGVDQTSQYLTPTFSTVLSWRPLKRWTYSLGYNLQYYRYFNAVGSFRKLSTSGSDLDTQNPYFLTTLSEGLVYDSRNDPINPRRGAYGTLGLDEAAPPGDFDFLRLNADGRIFRPLGRAIERMTGWRPPLYFAGRLGGGLIQPYALFGTGRDSVPFAERLTLGGSTSVRGWTSEHLGPYAWACDSSDSGWCFSSPTTSAPADTEILPTGGLISVFGSAELRAWLTGRWDDVGFVAFTDSGMVWSDWSTLGEIAPQWSVGGGVRYKTPVGPLRLDLARRLGDPVVFQQEPHWALYFSLSEAF